MSTRSKRSLKASALLALALALVAAQLAVGQRNDESGENDDFDDPGFDDNGYHQPQRDTDSSNHQPNQYSPDSAADEDDEPDETHVSPQVAREQRERAQRRQAHQQEQQRQYRPRQRLPYTGSAQHFEGPQQQQHQHQFYPVGPVMLAGPVDGAMNEQVPHQMLRFRRSASEGDIEDLERRRPSQRSLVRRRRHSKGYLGPVYTYVKTDKHANFKWGVKHKVGKHMG